MAVAAPNASKSLSLISRAQTASMFPRIGAIAPLAKRECIRDGTATIVIRREPPFA